MDKTKVLYISYDGLTDPLGQSQVIPYLKGLATTFEIHVISAEKKDNFVTRRSIIETILVKANIIWHPIQYTKSPPIISTVFDIYKIRRKANNLHQKERFKIVHCRSYISSIIGLEMKRRFGCKFIFDMRGFWADERVDGKLWNLKNTVFYKVYQYFKFKEKEFLEEADFTISLTENAKSEIYTWKEIRNNPIPIKVIPCCVDLDHFSYDKIDKKSSEQLRIELGLQKNDFILIYLGGIGTWYMLDEMLDFYKRLKLKKQDSKFLFITTENEGIVRECVDRKGIEQSSIVVKKAERKDVPLFISIADLSIFFIKPAYSKKASSPTKQGELMGMGVPVICNANVGDTDFVIKKFKSGILIERFENDEYDKSINDLDEILNLDKSELRKGAEIFFSLEKGVSSYCDVYNELLR